MKIKRRRGKSVSKKSQRKARIRHADDEAHMEFIMAAQFESMRILFEQETRAYAHNLNTTLRTYDGRLK
jgi:hypothetical protein